jgi:hypothetical protein
MSIGDLPQRVPVRKRRRLAILPTTRLGKWAVGLAAANVVLVLGWRLMGPLGAMPGFAFGLAGGIVALVGISRRGERAITVFAAIVPAVLVVLFILVELLIGHD